MQNIVVSIVSWLLILLPTIIAAGILYWASTSKMTEILAMTDSKKAWKEFPKAVKKAKKYSTMCFVVAAVKAGGIITFSFFFGGYHVSYKAALCAITYIVTGLLIRKNINTYLTKNKDELEQQMVFRAKADREVTTARIQAVASVLEKHAEKKERKDERKQAHKDMKFERKLDMKDKRYDHKMSHQDMKFAAKIEDKSADREFRREKAGHKLDRGDMAYESKIETRAMKSERRQDRKDSRIDRRRELQDKRMDNKMISQQRAMELEDRQAARAAELQDRQLDRADAKYNRKLDRKDMRYERKLDRQDADVARKRELQDRRLDDKADARNRKMELQDRNSERQWAVEDRNVARAYALEDRHLDSKDRRLDRKMELQDRRLDRGDRQFDRQLDRDDMQFASNMRRSDAKFDQSMARSDVKFQRGLDAKDRRIAERAEDRRTQRNLAYLGATGGVLNSMDAIDVRDGYMSGSDAQRRQLSRAMGAIDVAFTGEIRNPEAFKAACKRAGVDTEGKDLGQVAETVVKFAPTAYLERLPDNMTTEEKAMRIMAGAV